MARVTKSFSLDDKFDKDIIKKLDEVPNRSDYIKNLIAEDLKTKKDVFSTKEKNAIKKIVLGILENYDLQDKVTKEVIVDKDEKKKAMEDMGW
ncbi:hypothetical protein HMPREF1092_03293 [Clostridium thermobutyricum]|uniref:Uncharacterized protein n=1 Tax=Clostridium thermobutyricum TaxID=29372 RepID=N9W6W1_9CLOT|nr:hypothetical protein [Clostridium thermobutyricum]ENY98735.1 hypothetical protein HMPREF1092_03293 [Clostridium thermobutyricum]